MPRRVCLRSFHETLHCARVDGKPGRRELPRAPGPGEEATIVRVPLGADHDDPRKAGRLEVHGSTVAVGMGTMNWPPHSRMWES